MDQSPKLGSCRPCRSRGGAVEEPTPLGPFRTFQVPVPDIAELTGVDPDQLIAANRMPIASTLSTARVGTTWRELGELEDIDL